MEICQLEIHGFRAIRSAKIDFQRHTVILGPNAVGKSAIVDALGLILGREKFVRPIGDHGFYGSSPSADARIKIVATITDFPKNDVDFNQFWLNHKDGATPLWWDGKNVKCCVMKRLIAGFAVKLLLLPDLMKTVWSMRQFAISLTEKATLSRTLIYER